MSDEIPDLNILDEDNPECDSKPPGTRKEPLLLESECSEILEVSGSPGHRKFYELGLQPELLHPLKRPSLPNISISSENVSQSREVFSFIRENLIGRNTIFKGPFGTRRALYCDYVASGQSLEFIEDYIRKEVLPCYGNTHTTTTVTSLQTTLFRHEARDIVRNAVGAGDKDAVIFTGSGTTGAVHKLINALKPVFDHCPPYVFVGPYEHHSNLLPWRELGGKVFRIKETSDGVVDLSDLETQLRESDAPSGTLKIGCFAIASNVTGILVPDLAISSILRKYEALAFWDCAAGAPYVAVDMNPKGPWGVCPKDAIFFSMHKFVGGPETPGILVAKEDLFINQKPDGAGGGTVFFVTEKNHSYLKNVEDREEGGTPPIIQSIRAGLAMRVKEWATTQAIGERERELCSLAFSSFATCEELLVLGSHSAPRLPIFSFLVKPKMGRYLHHNYVCAVLNDVFGIQSRGGCACAGPYAEDLLGIDLKLAESYETLLKEDDRLDRSTLRRRTEGSQYEMLRPGFTRLNFAYFLDDDQAKFVIDAVIMAAENAWKLLPYYKFNPETGEWRHNTESIFRDRLWMGSLSLEKGKLVSNRNAEEGLHSPPQSFEACLEEARKIFANASADCSKVSLPDQAVMFRDVDRLRWFMLPSEALEILQRGSRCEIASDVPFVPKSYESYTPRNWVDFVPEIPSVTTANIVQKAMKTAKAELDPKSKSLVNIEDLGRVSNNFDNSPTARNSLVTDNRRKSLEKIVDRQPISNLISTMSLMDVTREEFNDGVQVTSSSVLELNPDDGENNQEESSSLKFERRDSKRIALVSKSVISRGWHTPPKSIYKPTVEAINEFKMLRDGDKVLVCLSGGKDSLSLLHTLHQYQYAASASGVKFLLGAITVDPQSSFYDPSPLIPYLETLGVSYFYEEQGIIEKASQIPDLQSICSFCSRMKRGRLYAAARREGWNVLALGQHLDDLTESFFMSIFHNGRLRTMKAHYAVKENDLRVVRPFVYVREKDLRQFAEYQGLPIIAENCPGCFDAPKERYRIKQMLAQQEVMFPKLFASLLSALHPLMAFGRVGVESKIMGTRFSWKKDGEDANFYFNLDDEEIDAMHEPTQL